jgi:hypothetical protein
VNELITTGLLINKTTKHKRPILTEKLDDIEATLEHTPRKSLKRLAQETECQSLVQEGNTTAEA